MLATCSTSASAARTHSISPSDFEILSYEALVGARRLVRCLCLPQHDLEDIRHELLVDLLPRLRSFSPARGTLGAFAGKIVKHRSARIASRIKRERGVFLSLEAVVLEASNDGVGHTVRPLLSSALLAEHHPPVEDRIDFKRALCGLTHTELQLCTALVDATPTEIGRSSGFSRAGVYRAIGKIRAHMTNNGIRAAA